MEELVRYIVQELVSDPSLVEVTMTPESDTVMVINVKVAKEEMGRVIGKSGNIADSIRRIDRAWTYKSDKKYSVKIGEPTNGWNW